MFGEDSLRHYREEGIDVSGVLRSDKPSGIALIIVDNGAENSIVVASGANLDIHAADLEASESALRSCDILLLQLEIPVPAVLQAARIANASGATVILNPAPFAALPDEIFRYISLFIPNETELASFSGMPVRDVPTAVAAADVLFAKGVGKMIITMGSKGSLILDGGEPRFIQARRVKAVDTTGAGDTYCGALCVAIAEGKTLPEAAEFASAVSALSVTKMGAQTAMPKRVEAEAFMNQ